MSEYIDSDDPFADFTADDLDSLESAAIQAIRHPLAPRPLPHHSNLHNAPPAPFQDDIFMDSDCGQFNVDEEDLFIAKTSSTPSSISPSIDRSALMAELTALRAETARLNLERDTLETQKYTQEGKMDHLQRMLEKTRTDYESALARLKQSSATEKRNLQSAIADRERKLATLNAEIEFQKNEIREARESATRGQVIRPGHGETSPTKKQGAARVVVGSGVKSPESKARIGIFSAKAFGRDESVGSSKVGGGNLKKRKREESGQITPEPQPSMAVQDETVSEAEINRIVMEKVLRERAAWKSGDERFEVRFGAGNKLTVVDERCAFPSDRRRH